MSRRDALLRLHKRLVAKRDALRDKLVDQGSGTHAQLSQGGDVGDAANDGASNELESQLAAFESRELRQVNRALEAMRQGRYGLCENCAKPIPIARLNALPFAPMCVSCAQLQENSNTGDLDDAADWETAYEFEGRMSDREFSLGDIDVDS